MLIDADDLEPDIDLVSDVCIIGAGAAGITLALELIDSGLDVVLLESGRAEPDSATQALYEGESVGEPVQTLDRPLTLEALRLRYLGGTTNHWAGYCRPLDPVDFAVREGFAVSGWPLDRDDLVPYWERAAEWCRIGDADFDQREGATRAGLPPPPAINPPVTPVLFKVAFPMPFGAVYREVLETAESLRVVLGANVVNLATDDGRSITGVDVRTLESNQIHVEASAYVLATGAIENARLLLASTDDDPSGVGNGNDMVGRHFAEHLQIYAGFGVLDAGADDLAGFTGTDAQITAGRHEGSTYGVKFGLALDDAHVAAEATTGLEVQILLGHLPDGVPLQEEGATALDVADLLGAQDRPPRTAVYLQGLAEQRLDPESRVTLADATDALGMRRARLDWRYSPADRAAVIDGLDTMAEQVGASGAGRLQLVPGGVHADAYDTMLADELITLYRSVPGDLDPETFPIGVGFHHMCTTRMAADPTEGVVDAECRVHGVDNLWIAGSSVFGTGGVATPTFTIVALAVRLADHLRDLVDPR